ncbi:hypothetical protein Pst134EA_017397 [Puccinia striiformis f. sp. tritici]|nr:uncharacterized protein Pst134EA_032645 [Puccinia striiformis f. sp. tritici]XP_047804035.1 hypothetical protein Pst134EA_017397 [Puccinia striiformis f. sp. tritici]KAH9440804.1 hypothetical protein Pst134EA_032645 [Puccinia striiformis f. sp. tritici]KAH9461088.1 hypothetical protein Pst134EA_017397 [Puccinia striiformis f. sp. tritici]
MDITGCKRTKELYQRPPDTSSLEERAVIKAALKEHQLEKRWFHFSSLYRMIFQRRQWKQDQLYLKLRNLKEISSSGGINPPEAQLAIDRLSILEYKGFDFSAKEGQLIENLSKQAKSKSPRGEDMHFELIKEDRELINHIAWERVLRRKVEEIARKMKDFRRLEDSGNEDAGKIVRALRHMERIMSYDKARWSPETTRLLETIKAMKTDGDSPKLLLDTKDIKTVRDLEKTWARMKLDKFFDKAAAAEAKSVMRSGSRGEVPFRDATTHTFSSSGHINNNVKASDEEVLLGLIAAKEHEVATKKGSMYRDGSEAYLDIHERQPFISSLEELGIDKTALKEHRSKKSRFVSSKLYRRLFKWNQWNQDQLELKLKKLRKISLSGAIDHSRAQLAIDRLSLLKSQGIDFSKAQGQLIEELSKQVKSIGAGENNKEFKFKFKLTKNHEELIENIAWEKVIGRMVTTQ